MQGTSVCPWGHVESVSEKLQALSPATSSAKQLLAVTMPLLLGPDQLLNLLRSHEVCSDGASANGRPCSRDGCPCHSQGGANQMPLLRGIAHNMLRLLLVSVVQTIRL